MSVAEQDIALSAKAKGKAKEKESSSQSSSPASSSDTLDNVQYPPASEHSEETRRVEENLRRWEVAERQRRKAARGSSLSTNSSLIDDVARRASLLWSTRSSKHPSVGGSHAALQSQEAVDALPLQQLPISPTPSTTPSPTHSQSDVTHINDPFANPPESLSPFSDSFRTDQTTPPSNQPESESLANPNSAHKPPLSSQAVRHPPLPMPLNLPPPRTPPRQMSPLPSSDLFEEQDHAQAKPVRWWHDWLCGCGEGPDRGGEFQAGRTNPFE